MTARPATELPDQHHSDDYTFEPKLDGWRCLAFHRVGGHVVLQSRQQRPLTTYFPDIAAAIAAQIPSGTVLDGELVVPDSHGKSDFEELGRRNLLQRPRMIADAAARRPAVLVVFDPA